MCLEMWKKCMSWLYEIIYINKIVLCCIIGYLDTWHYYYVPWVCCVCILSVLCVYLECVVCVLSVLCVCLECVVCVLSVLCVSWVCWVCILSVLSVYLECVVCISWVCWMCILSMLCVYLECVSWVCWVWFLCCSYHLLTHSLIQVKGRCTSGECIPTHLPTYTPTYLRKYLPAPSNRSDKIPNNKTKQ